MARGAALQAAQRLAQAPGASVIRRPTTWSLATFALLAGLWHASTASAQLIEMPLDSEFLTLPGDAVLCDEAVDGFVVDATRRRVRPRMGVAPGYEVSVRIAPRANGCATTSTPITLIVTGDHPSFDLDSVTVGVDGGRIELSGRRLEGVRIGYSADGRTGSDVCLNVTREKEREHCAVGVPQDLPADPRRMSVTWAPAGGRIAPDMLLYDRHGRPVPAPKLQLPIARMLLQRMFPASRTVDLGSNQGRLQLEHPEALSDVECGNARCELREGQAIVGSLPATAQSLSVRIRLLPRVFIVHGESNESTASETLSVLRCPLQVVSSEPLRNADDVQILVRLDSACGAKVDELRWTVSSDPADVARVETLPDGVYVLLWVGRIARDRVTIIASRPESGSVLAVTSTKTVEVPAPNSGVSLPGFGEVDFIPRNRDAFLTLSHVEITGTLVPISVRGAYTIAQRPDGYYIRGDSASSGFTSVHFAYRFAPGPAVRGGALSPHVPEAFAMTDFAHLIDPVQRPIREASLPAPIASSSLGAKPTVELYCAQEGGKLTRMEPGSSQHIAFDRRDSCRLLVHRDRIPADAGEQRLELQVSVTAVGGAERGEAHMQQQLRLRHGDTTDVIWIRGAKEQFDRIDVHLTHVIDESLFAQGSKTPIALPSSQWSVVTEDAHLRFYATAAIPGSLYRFSDDPGDLGTGPLSLNFGVLSRLTWLDDSGHEGLLGLEGGVMGMGLATDRERQLALVVGFGLALPLGNPNQLTQAAINIHAWLAYTVGDRTAPLLDEMGRFDRQVKLNPWAFVFGPSITVGSIGVFL
jgi:hypothetical protein